MGLQLLALAIESHVQEIEIQAEIADCGKNILLEIIPF